MALNTSFERTMTKSSPKCITIPVRFVREFEAHIQRYVRVKMAGGQREWRVRVNVYFIKGQPHVSFGTGWKQFIQSNVIVQGQRLRFTLVKKSLFTVRRVA